MSRRERRDAERAAQQAETERRWQEAADIVEAQASSISRASQTGSRLTVHQTESADEAARVQRVLQSQGHDATVLKSTHAYMFAEDQLHEDSYTVYIKRKLPRRLESEQRRYNSPTLLVVVDLGALTGLKH